MKRIAFALLASVVVACSAAAMKEEARDAYTAQQMDCVKQFDTRAEIDACRARVKENWGRNSAADAGAKDGAK